MNGTMMIQPAQADLDDSAEQTRVVTVTVNGVPHTAETRVRWTLADFLRHRLKLTGTHIGCEHGVCGACTVLVDGLSTRACLMLAVQAHEHEVTTVEGLAAADGTLHPLQQALHETHGLQCGFCTPGMLTTLKELLDTNPAPTEEDVRVAISGNLCRCTGYDGIVKATLLAAERMRKGASA
ncbi:MAG: (2Fe-2S)-binding protein [Pigmentiphaga sp.]|uniref:(2Fe-2S)-binding protein n=1 Tax=Pigmentiphaga sp. TaxID=1977564 RepID=UPI0029B1210D|nr:(2Fe-2S)-binding protein [Pigmentiphaga sp.]MDX3908032.1 (2Fe-2S)-binding protein [Pigmentiphaga sp.]